jgi:hypothetical protein
VARVEELLEAACVARAVLPAELDRGELEMNG